MGIRWVVGATNDKRRNEERDEPQNNMDRRNGNREGGRSNYDRNGGGREQPMRSYYPPMPPMQQHVPVHAIPQDTGGGGATSVGLFGGPMYFGDPSQNEPQNRQMGYLATETFEPEDRRGRGGYTRSEEDREPMNRSGGRRRHERGEEEEEMNHGWAEERGGSHEGMQELKRKIKRLEEKLEDSDSGREVKKLKSRIEELEEKLDGMKREKRSGKSKSGKGEKEEDDDDDEDDEDGPARLLEKAISGKGVTGKEFLSELPTLFQEAIGVIKAPPSTWPPYLEKKDFAGIYTMESKELTQALEGFKAGQKKLKDVERELKHTTAALIQLYCHQLHENK